VAYEDIEDPCKKVIYYMHFIRKPPEGKSSAQDGPAMPDTALSARSQGAYAYTPLLFTLT
jgi:hypothetical protein